MVGTGGNLPGVGAVSGSGGGRRGQGRRVTEGSKGGLLRRSNSKE